MEELLKKADISPQLRNFLLRVVSEESSNLTEPCYYPKLKAKYFQLLSRTGLTEEEIKTFIDKFYEGSKVRQTWFLERSPFTILLLLIAFYFTKKKDMVGYIAAWNFLVIMYYSNFLHKNLKFCNKNIFSYTLDHLTKTHLFYRERTIPSALTFLARQLSRKYRREIKFPDPNDFSKLIRETRTRVAASLKSFLNSYFSYQKEGVGYVTSDEEDEMTSLISMSTQRQKEFIRSVAEKISIYRHIDRKAIEDARKITRVSSSLAKDIAASLNNPKYSRDLELILTLFFESSKQTRVVCSPIYFSHIRKLMAIKRTTKQVYFKKQILLLLDQVLKDIKFKQTTTQQTKFMMNLYLAYYITMVFRNIVC